MKLLQMQPLPKHRQYLGLCNALGLAEGLQTTVLASNNASFAAVVCFHRYEHESIALLLTEMRQSGTLGFPKLL